MLATLGIGKPPGEQFVEWGDFSVAQANPDKPVTLGLHIGFVLDPDGNNVEVVDHDRG